MKTPVSGRLRSSPTLPVLGTFAVNVTNLLLGLVSSVMTARGLTPDERGVLLALVVWSASVASVSLIGLDEAVIFHASGSVGRAMALCRLVARAAITQAVIGTGALALVGCVIVRPDSLAEFCTVALVVGIVPLNSINQLFMAQMRVAGRLTAWNLVRLLPQVCYAGGVVVLAGMGQLTVLGGVSFLVAGIAAAAVIVVGLVRRMGPPEKLSPEQGPRTSSYGRRLVVATLPYQLAPRMDQLLLGLAFAPTLLGVYSVAAALAGMILVLGVSLEQVLFPRYVSLAGTGAGALRTSLWAMSASVAAGVALWWVAGWGISFFYGDAYAGAGGPLDVLIVAAVLRVGSSVFSAASKASGSLVALTRANFAGLVASIVGFAALTPAFNLQGAAYSALIGSAVSLLILVAGWYRENGRDTTSADRYRS